MHPKDADGMANSTDPNQTASSEAVWSWSALLAETYLSQYIEFVWYPGWLELPFTGTNFHASTPVWATEVLLYLFCMYQKHIYVPYLSWRKIFMVGFITKLLEVG